MKSALLEAINTLEAIKEAEILKVRREYDLQLSELRKQCNHVDDDGMNALTPAGRPWHAGWDSCNICGHYIESNEYDSSERP